MQKSCVLVKTVLPTGLSHPGQQIWKHWPEILNFTNLVAWAHIWSKHNQIMWRCSGHPKCSLRVKKWFAMSPVCSTTEENGGNSIISKCKGRRSVRGRSRHHLKQLSFIWKSPESVERERSQIVWCHETRTSPAIFELHSICTPKWNYSIIMLSSNQRHCRIYGNHSLPSYPGSHPCDGSHEHRCG